MRNINRKFFKNDVAFESDEERSDGKIIVRQKGTIQLLNDWLRNKKTKLMGVFKKELATERIGVN